MEVALSEQVNIGLGKLKKSTSLGIELETFWLVAHCLDQLRYRVPLIAEVI
jgi:hypothetical protein